MTEAYPLQWPDGWPRTPYYRQRASGSIFGKLTLARARARTAHPDAGGSEEAMSRLNVAIQRAREQLSA